MNRVRTCVIFNPAAGRGRARRRVEATRAWAAPGAELMPTNAAGHAVELAKTAAENGFERIIAAGGDGTVHEVANGILTSSSPSVLLGVWPLGSSNDYAGALGLKRWHRRRGQGIELIPRAVDVGLLLGAVKRTYYVNCMGIGFNGLLALEARGITWLRGLPLYTLAFLRTMWWQYATPTVAVTWDESTIEEANLCASVNLGPCEGGFAITKRAILDDGLFDAVRVPGLKRWQLLRYLPNLILGALPKRIAQGRCRRAAFRSPEPMCVHADGEFFAVPSDNVTEFAVEMLPGRLRVEAARRS